jgi:hypothetical protein
VKSDEREEASAEIETRTVVVAPDPLEIGLSHAMPEVALSVIVIRMLQPGAEVATEVGADLLTRIVERGAEQTGVAQRVAAQRSQEVIASHVRHVDELPARISPSQ